jgi:hypothetical protein
MDSLDVSMDRREAREIITSELAKYRTWSYDQLRAIVGATKRTFEVTAASGKRYYIDIYAHWMPNRMAMCA